MGIFDLFGSKKKKLAAFQSRGAVILDVRTREEYDLGAIPNAKHIALDVLPSKISEVKNWNKPVIAYCEKGGRSEKAANLLQANGVEVINGGGYSWLSKHL
ncbi:MAG: rhodanese-like domain-containing protein [Bacteroidota bacterium]